VLIAALGLSPSDIHKADRLLEPHGGTEGQLLLIEQLDEYDSCVGRVHIDPGNASFARLAAGGLFGTAAGLA